MLRMRTTWAIPLAIVPVSLLAVACTRTDVVREDDSSDSSSAEEQTLPASTPTIPPEPQRAVGPPQGIWFCFSHGTDISCGHSSLAVGVPMGKGYFAFQMTGCSPPGEATWSCTGRYAASGDQEITIPKAAFRGPATAPAAQWWCLVTASPGYVESIVCGNESFITNTPLTPGETLFQMSGPCSFQEWRGTNNWDCSGVIARSG
jgi:hypothetical protein